MKRSFFISSLMALIVSLWLNGLTEAQDKLTLTLDACVRRALEQNKKILQVEKDIEVGHSRVKQAKSAYFPQVDAQGSYTAFEGLPSIEFPIGEFVPGMPPGATEKVEMDFTRDYIASLTLQQPLFTWGRIRNAHKQAELGLNIRQESLRQQQQNVILDVNRVFYGALLAKESIRVAEEAVALAEEHLHTSEVRYEAGEASEFDFLRAKVQLANLQPQVIKARDGLKLALLALKNLLGMPQNREIELVGAMISSERTLTLDQCLHISLERRPEIFMLLNQKQIGRRTIKMAQANNKPSLAFVTRYQLENNDLFSGWDEWQKSYNGMLVLSVPIFDGFYTRAKVQEAKSSLSQIELAEQSLRDFIEFEVRQAVLALEQAGALLLSSQETVIQAQRSVEIAQERYREGTVTSLEVMDAELALTQSRTNHLVALHAVIISTAELNKAMGVIE